MNLPSTLSLKGAWRVPPNGIVENLQVSQWRTWLLGLALVAATIFAYQPIWHAGFIWDDDLYVTHNRLLSAPDGLQRIWFSLDSPSQYFPLTYTAFRVEHALWGLNPAGYHWVNLLLHAANALLVWRLLKRLGVPGAWLAAAIFSLHPVQVESVAWITELKNILSLFFSLLTLLAWIEFVGAETGRRRPQYFLALMFYSLAILSKTTACTLPAGLFLILWLKGGSITRSRLVQIVPFLALGAGMGLLAMWWERYHQGTEGRFFSLGLTERVLLASRALWFYVGKLAWPANLTFSYPRWAISPADPFAYLWLIAGAGLAAVIFFTRRFFGRGVEVAVLFYMATLMPLLGLIMLYTFRYSFVADHYQYAAGIGPVALAAAGIAMALEFSGKIKMFLKPALYGVLLLTLGVLTWRQCGMYASLETLWRTTLARNPDSYLAHESLGDVLLRKGQVDEALVHFRRALVIQPGFAEAHCNLGIALDQQGRTDEAIVQLRKALELQADYPIADNNLGSIFSRQGQVDEAMAWFRRALAVQPDYSRAGNNLGIALAQKGLVDEAIAQFQKVLEFHPDQAEAHYNLGVAFAQQQRLDEAIVQFRKALVARPDYAEAHYNLGLALGQKGLVDEAVAEFQETLRLKPADADAKERLRTLGLPVPH